jgi:hypothetical protein
MDRLEAHAMFDRREDRSAMPADIEVSGCDAWPAACVAACELSGMLDDCRDDRDLDEALEHFQSLLEMGVMDDIKWKAVAFEVLDELMEWGERMDREAQLN